MALIQKAYKFRMYPDKDQEQMIRKTMGACRWVYNYGLGKIKEAYEKDKTKIKIADISKELPVLKNNQETAFLKEVSSIALIYALQNLDAAFKNFFRRIKKGNEAPGFPKFKSKHDRNQSFQFHQGYTMDVGAGLFSAPKIHNIKTIFHRVFEGTTKTCTISMTPTGKFFISILCEQEQEIKNVPKKSGKHMTIHLGLKNFAYTSDGQTISHPQYLIKNQKRLAILQRRLSRLMHMHKGKEKTEEFKGANINKARLRVAVLHEKIANMRADFLHNLSATLVRKMGVSVIRVENWDVREMMQENEYLAKYIGDSGWRTFWTELEYKSQWSGVTYEKVEKKLPSSKQCSECGADNNFLKKQTSWVCPICGTPHDREQNAIRNIQIARPVKNKEKMKTAAANG